MKIHEKLDLTLNEMEGYKKYEVDYYDFRLWEIKDDLEVLLKANSNNNDWATKRATEYIAAEIFTMNYLEEGKDISLVGDTPIERLYYHAFRYVCEKENIGLYLYPQAEIKVEDKTYRVDFVLYGDILGNKKVVVECDGHEWHSSKRQIAYDNQRQRDLENKGIIVIRFSGTEIFNDEIKCVYETLKRLDIEVEE